MIDISNLIKQHSTVQSYGLKVVLSNHVTNTCSTYSSCKSTWATVDSRCFFFGGGGVHQR